MLGLRDEFQIPAEKIGNAFLLSVSSADAGGGVSPPELG
jgi:hypothetical protein